MLLLALVRTSPRPNGEPGWLIRQLTGCTANL
jgi:hypothetical protein